MDASVRVNVIVDVSPLLRELSASSSVIAILARMLLTLIVTFAVMFSVESELLLLKYVDHLFRSPVIARLR